MGPPDQGGGPGGGLGSQYVVQANQMSEQDRRVFECKIGEYIDTVHRMVQIGDELKATT